MDRDRSNYLRDNNKLLEETLNDFSTKPFAFASLNDIVKRAEFNKGSFYYRFRDKEELYLAMIDLINAEHLVLYNQLVLELKKPRSSTGIVLAGFESLVRLHEVDRRYPLVLECFANEDEAFRQGIKRQSLDFVFDRMILDLKHVGLEMQPNDDVYLALVQLYHGIRLWPIDRRSVDRVAQMISAILPSVAKPVSKETMILKDMVVESSPHIAGLTYVLGSRRSGKTLFAKRLYEASKSVHSRIAFVSGQTHEVVAWTDGMETRLSFAKLARFGHKRWRKGNRDLDPWGNFLRLSPKGHDFCSVTLAMYELLSRQPTLLIVDEPNLLGERAERSLISEAFLKFSASGSTMVLASDVDQTLINGATQIQFLFAGELKAAFERQTLRSLFPADQMTVRFLEQGIERVARVPFSVSGMQTFLKAHSDAAILDVRSAAADWHHMYKTVTGEELS